MAQKLSGKGVEVLSIAVNDDQEAVQAFFDRTRMSFPVALDPTGDSMTAWTALGAPTTLILDKQGAIRHRITGQTDWEDVAMTDLLMALSRE